MLGALPDRAPCGARDDGTVHEFDPELPVPLSIDTSSGATVEIGSPGSAPDESTWLPEWTRAARGRIGFQRFLGNDSDRRSVRSVSRG